MISRTSDQAANLCVISRESTDRNERDSLDARLLFTPRSAANSVTRLIKRIDHLCSKRIICVAQLIMDQRLEMATRRYSGERNLSLYL